jgi:alkylresorcinol/alkylpyrone synthase
VAFLWSVATAVPPHIIDADELKRVGPSIFGGRVSPAAFARIVDQSRIRRRHTVRPLEELCRTPSVGQRMRWYQEATVDLGRRALAGALAAARVTPAEIGTLVVCTATGFLVPSVDAYLIDELGFAPGTRRLPLATLGCAGGAGGVLRAAWLLAGGPADEKVALVCVEAPTLTFRPGDRSTANLISFTLFGDGAAAAVLAATPSPDRPGLRVRATRTHLFPHTVDELALVLDDDGFHVRLSQAVPELAVRELGVMLGALAGDAGMTARDVSFYVLHPGGARVLQVIEKALGLTPRDTAAAWAVLGTHGNMSSPTVLFVLDEVLRTPPPPGSVGLLAAFGLGGEAGAALLEAIP